jgi:hypothetical protein
VRSTVARGYYQMVTVVTGEHGISLKIVVTEDHNNDK